jgi:ubiquinone/menaquinone biosynthesis C-methylase UbiE
MARGSQNQRRGKTNRRAPFNPIPPAYWDDAARTWGRQVYDRRSAHQFQYYEADLLISSILKPRMEVLELGCGTGEGTLKHASEVRRLIATDLSKDMVTRARTRAKRRGASRGLDFARADGSHLPLQSACIDAVIGRGVALSYVKNPRRALSEIHRVLRPGGKLAIDAMNALSPSSRPGRTNVRFRTVRRLRGNPVYIEQFNEGLLQVRRISYLRSQAPLAKLAARTKILRSRPAGLARQVLRTEYMHARYFPERRLRSLASEVGFSDVQIVPLGQLYRILMSKDRTLRDFTIRNRRLLSRLVLELHNHFRVNSGFHVMLMDTKGGRGAGLGDHPAAS